MTLNAPDHRIGIHRRIRAAGKKIPLLGVSPSAADRIAEAPGSQRGFVITTGVGAGEDPAAVKCWLLNYGVSDAN